jgi:molybdate transport repressor ModE-like protein
MTVRKRTSEPDWTSLRYLVELARHGSLSAAARALGVTHATVARRIEVLEQALSGPLLERANGRYAPNAQGQRILDLAVQMEEQALSITRVAAGHMPEIAGTVRLTCTDSLGGNFLAGRLGSLLERFPALRIEIITDNRNLSLARREADIALRMGRPNAGNIVARKLIDVSSHLYIARDAVERWCKSGKPVIGYDDAHADSPEALYLRQCCAESRVMISTNSQLARRAAVEAGVGAAVLPRFIAERSATLVRADETLPGLVRELWMLVHADLKDVPRIRETANFIADMLSAKRARFGPGPQDVRPVPGAGQRRRRKG